MKRDWLISLRKSKNLSQREVADASGISNNYYSWIETGERGNPLPVDTAKKIAEALGFDWTLFYEGEQA